jgi:hypothetical protein
MPAPKAAAEKLLSIDEHLVTLQLYGVGAHGPNGR